MAQSHPREEEEFRKAWNRSRELYPEPLLEFSHQIFKGGHRDPSF